MLSLHNYFSKKDKQIKIKIKSYEKLHIHLVCKAFGLEIPDHHQYEHQHFISMFLSYKYQVFF